VDEDDLTGDPLPGPEQEVVAEDAADRQLRRALTKAAVITGLVLWSVVVATVCTTTLLLALVHPEQLEGFAKFAYPSIGGASILITALVSALGPQRQRKGSGVKKGRGGKGMAG
jgi:hypothetical protein